MTNAPNSERLICPNCSAKFVSTKTVRLPDSTQVGCSTCKTRFPLAQGRLKDHIDDANTSVEPTQDTAFPSSFFDGLPPQDNVPPPRDEPLEDEFSTGRFDHETPFAARTKGFAKEVIEAVSPSVGEIPTDISEVLDPREIIFASHPSKTVKLLTMVLLLIATFPIMVIMLVQLYFLLTGRSSIEMLAIICTELIGVVLPFYILNLSWKNTYYVITRDKIVIRAGIFNRAIKIAWVKNIQEISINSGVIDRWLNLNTIHFATASSGIGGLLLGWLPGSTLGGIHFRHVELNKVLRALKSVEL